MAGANGDFAYSHPVDLSQVRSRLKEQIDEIVARSERYRDNAGRYGFWSIVLRVLALVSVACSALATYLLPDSLGDKDRWPSPEELAMFLLILTGVFVLADQVITGTASWARHKLAELLTGDVAENLELEAVQILANVPDGHVYSSD